MLCQIWCICLRVWDVSRICFLRAPEIVAHSTLEGVWEVERLRWRVLAGKWDHAVLSLFLSHTVLEMMMRRLLATTR